MNRLLGGYWGCYNGAVNPQGSYPGHTGMVGANTGCYALDGSHFTVGEVALPVDPPSFSRSNRYQEFALYSMDSWKATRKLTVNLGLRYEFFGTQHNNNQQLDSNYYFAQMNLSASPMATF
jgi:outer membrane receptor protein involved in Fe transport